VNATCASAAPYQHCSPGLRICSRIGTFAVVSLVAFQVFVPEYLQDGGTAAKSALYSTCAGQLRIVDVAVPALVGKRPAA